MTFVINLILPIVDKKDDHYCFMDVAATLLAEGKMAYSVFKLLLNIVNTGNSVSCQVKGAEVGL